MRTIQMLGIEMALNYFSSLWNGNPFISLWCDYFFSILLCFHSRRFGIVKCETHMMRSLCLAKLQLDVFEEFVIIICAKCSKFYAKSISSFWWYLRCIHGENAITFQFCQTEMWIVSSRTFQHVTVWIWILKWKCDAHKENLEVLIVF